MSAIFSFKEMYRALIESDPEPLREVTQELSGLSEYTYNEMVSALSPLEQRSLDNHLKIAKEAIACLRRHTELDAQEVFYLYAVTNLVSIRDKHKIHHLFTKAQSEKSVQPNPHFHAWQRLQAERIISYVALEDRDSVLDPLISILSSASDMASVKCITELCTSHYLEQIPRADFIKTIVTLFANIPKSDWQRLKEEVEPSFSSIVDKVLGDEHNSALRNRVFARMDLFEVPPKMQQLHLIIGQALIDLIDEEQWINNPVSAVRTVVSGTDTFRPEFVKLERRIQSIPRLMKSLCERFSFAKCSNARYRPELMDDVITPEECFTFNAIGQLLRLCLDSSLVIGEYMHKGVFVALSLLHGAREKSESWNFAYDDRMFPTFFGIYKAIMAYEENDQTTILQMEKELEDSSDEQARLNIFKRMKMTLIPLYLIWQGMTRDQAPLSDYDCTAELLEERLQGCRA